ncbi:uncharacterized protein METZ01_LOCUS276338, partial [marine metagenome]
VSSFLLGQTPESPGPLDPHRESLAFVNPSRPDKEPSPL